MNTEDYSINLGAWRSVFAVPCDVVDRHLRLAGAPQLRVLLYILRHSGEHIPTEDLAMAAGCPETELPDCIEYWVNCGLIAAEDYILSPAPAPVRSAMNVEFADEVEVKPVAEAAPVAEQPQAPAAPASEAAAGNPAIVPPTVAAANGTPKKREHIRYAYEECMDMLSEDADLRQMLTVIEGFFSKPLNHTDVAVFVTLVRYYGLPTGCVAMLVEYCLSIGKLSIAYIEQTGRGWAQDEINTIDRANEKIRSLRSAHSAWVTVRTALDIPERKPSAKESELSVQWVETMKLGVDLIKLAYDRCIDTKGKLSMSYMNGILANWYRSGITTADAALADMRSASAGKSSGGDAAKQGRYAPTYDKSGLDEQLLQEWIDDSSDA